MNPSEHTQRSQPLSSRPSESGERERILLVDDEPQVLVAIEDLLSDDFIVLKTESPETALRIAHSEGVAVVISDQRMPKMNGDELFAKLAASSGAARILVTGYADLSAVIRAVNEGRIFAYVTKPWSPDDLRMKVRQAAEHFRLEHELAHERALLSRVLDSMGDGVVALDAEGQVLALNPAAEKILGLGARELSPSTWLHACGIFLPDQKTRLPTEKDPLARAMAGQVMKETEIYVRNATTQGAEVTVTTAPLRDYGSTTVGGLAVFRDVTEQKRLERRLTQAQKMEAIGQLAGGVAHDFNNLLAVITGYGELVRQEFEPGEEAYDDTGELLAAAERAAQLTKHLLAFSRRQIRQQRVLDLNEVVSNVEKMLGRVIGEDIDFKTVLAPKLGVIRADPNQLEQVILNLAVNARDAMPQGGQLTIETSNIVLDAVDIDPVSPLRPGEFVVLAVSDTGTGMDAETRKHIFEPFYTTKEPGKGTGLGLATVYGIVQQCEGQLWLHSEVGRGTTFKIYIPRIESPQMPTQPPRRTLSPPAASATILLVEDDDAVRQVTARILRDQGHTVLEARAPSEARALCAQHGPAIDLLLTDVAMPEESGSKLADELTRQHPGLRVLYMSGYSGAAAARHGTLAEGAAYLEKPFTTSSLTAKVRDVLEVEP